MIREKESKKKKTMMIKIMIIEITITKIIVSNRSFPRRGVRDFLIESKRKKNSVDHYCGDTKKGKRKQ